MGTNAYRARTWLGIGLAHTSNGHAPMHQRQPPQKADTRPVWLASLPHVQSTLTSVLQQIV